MAGSYFKHHKYLYETSWKVCLRWEYNFKTLFEVWQKAKTTLYYKDIYYNSSHDNASYAACVFFQSRDGEIAY